MGLRCFPEHDQLHQERSRILFSDKSSFHLCAYDGWRTIHRRRRPPTCHKVYRRTYGMRCNSIWKLPPYFLNVLDQLLYHIFSMYVMFSSTVQYWIWIHWYIFYFYPWPVGIIIACNSLEVSPGIVDFVPYFDTTSLLNFKLTLVQPYCWLSIRYMRGIFHFLLFITIRLYGSWTHDYRAG